MTLGPSKRLELSSWGARGIWPYGWHVMTLWRWISLLPMAYYVCVGPSIHPLSIPLTQIFWYLFLNGYKLLVSRDAMWPSTHYPLVSRWAPQLWSLHHNTLDSAAPSGREIIFQLVCCQLMILGSTICIYEVSDLQGLTIVQVMSCRHHSHHVSTYKSSTCHSYGDPLGTQNSQTTCHMSFNTSCWCHLNLMISHHMFALRRRGRPRRMGSHLVLLSKWEPLSLEPFKKSFSKFFWVSTFRASGMATSSISPPDGSKWRKKFMSSFLGRTPTPFTVESSTLN